MTNNNINKYKLKKTISMKKFISEFGGNFSPHIKERLLDLEIRSVLTRKEDINILDIKHVEHTKYTSSNESDASKELSFGKLIALDDDLYFSNVFIQSDNLMQDHKITALYDSLKTGETMIAPDITAKKIDDENIDFFMDEMLQIIPEVSKEYIKIVKEMLAYDKK